MAQPFVLSIDMTTISLENAKEPKKLKLRKPENLGDTGEEKKTKAKPKEAKKPKIATFPCEGFVNKYHFMRVSPAVLEALGWKISGDRLAVEIDLVNGELVIRKPSK
jgi:hypothetical protein